MGLHFSTVELNCWPDFHNFVSQLSENWAFRGQASAAWVLNNAIERTAFIHFRDGIEGEFLAEFQRGARNYLHRDELPEHLIEWLALMQHHGAPTRLLDLTRSPYIAAYFAFEHCRDTEQDKVAVWCINIGHLKKKALELLAQEFGEALAQQQNRINEALFEKLFYENRLNLVFPVEPFSMNRRYSMQQSVFLSTGTSNIPFMQQLEFLGNDLQKSVIKIAMPGQKKKEVLRELQAMNLHRASLFPDLDGYALSLRLRYDSMKTPREVEAERERKHNDPDYRFFP